MKPYRLLKVLLCMGIILLVATYLVIHWVWLPPERSFPAITFITYTNASSGKQFALVAVTNRDTYAITFRDDFISLEGLNNTHCVKIQSSLADKTMSPSSSCTAMLEVPPHTNLWEVVFVVTRHTLVQRSCGWFFATNRFDEVYGSQWFPK
jgi:hypothetical protein